MLPLHKIPKEQPLRSRIRLDEQRLYGTNGTIRFGDTTITTIEWDFTPLRDTQWGTQTLDTQWLTFDNTVRITTDGL